jgi:TorA maturation chaperone TorD
VPSDQYAETVDDVDRARTQEYELLAVLLAKAPDADLLSRLAMLEGDLSSLGAAHAGLSAAARAANAGQVEREFFELFIGVCRGELSPYASYYLNGALHGPSLAQLRTDLADLGIARVEGCTEPEDHAAVLCEIMARLIDKRFQTPVVADRDMYQKHLAPWIGQFFADLERARSADFYRRVGAVGQQFMAVESAGFKLGA